MDVSGNRMFRWAIDVIENKLTSSTRTHKLFRHWRSFVAPFIGAALVCVISYIQKVKWGGDLPYDLEGYATPALVGWVAGSLVSVGIWRSRELMFRLQHTSMALKEQAEKKSHILNAVGVGICEFDVDGLCCYANREACRMLGYSSVEMSGKNILALFRYHDRSGQDVTLEPLWAHRKSDNQSRDTLYKEILWQREHEMIATEICIYPALNVKDGGILVFRDTSVRRAMQSKINFLESCDPLTQLNNKKTFMSELATMIDRVRNQNVRYALFLVDIDRFQTLYDTLGSYASDQLLIQFAYFLQGTVSDQDVVARIGGDRFAVLKKVSAQQEARCFAQWLVTESQSFELPWHLENVTLTVSVGVKIIEPGDESVDDVFLGAEKSCGQAKAEGRSRFKVYNPLAPVYRKLNRQIRALPFIREALQDDLFFLRRQKICPIGNVATHDDCYEVLLSMQLADGSSLAPEEFLTAAERYDLMPSIDRWVINHCFDWLEEDDKRWQSLDFMAINLSGKSFNDPTFLAYLEAKLQRAKFPAQKICFEITETAAVENEARSVAFIHRIKRFGCRFALDDFGSGMSSFRYLKNFPVDLIKIDGSFVVDMVENELSREIVTSIHNIASALGLKTVAEHAENQQTLHALEEIGVDFVQGFVIEKPTVFCVGQAVDSPEPLAHCH